MSLPATEAVGDVVVELDGEYDFTDRETLAAVLARAAATGRGNVVVDVSHVTFMGVVPLTVLARASTDLRLRSRTLVLRSPSPFLRRVVELCGYSDALGLECKDEFGRAPALSTWVDVPASGSSAKRLVAADATPVGDGGS